MLLSPRNTHLATIMLTCIITRLIIHLQYIISRLTKLYQKSRNYLTFVIVIQYSNIVNSNVAEVIESGCSNICPIIDRINSKCQCFYALYTCTIILLQVMHIMSACIECDHHYIMTSYTIIIKLSTVQSCTTHCIGIIIIIITH